MKLPRRERLVFDIESDNLLDKITRVWLIRTKNIDTGERRAYLEGDLSWAPVFNNAELLIGHNILGFDLPALDKVLGFKLSGEVKVVDTLLYSQILDYKRFGMRGHSLALWGQYLRFPKIEFSDYSKYSKEMDVYCEQDVDLNERVYIELMEERTLLAKRKPEVIIYLAAEHSAARWNASANLYGWPFAKEEGYKVLERLTEVVERVQNALQVKMGHKAVIPPADKKGGEILPKRMSRNSNGDLPQKVKSWFGLEEFDFCDFPEEELPIAGDYCRVSFEPLKLGYAADVKGFLFKQGWVPDEWNTKFNPETKRKEVTSPKITETSLEVLGGDGPLYREYSVASSRRNNLITWLSDIDEKDRVHGSAMLIGTPSMRSTHKAIANIPKGSSAWGSEIRSLFRVNEGWTLIGCDSKGNQARGLGHYLKDEEFIRVLLYSDIHDYNRKNMTSALRKMDVGLTVEREASKRIFYALLFGASGGKLWSYLFGKIDDKQGNKFKKLFFKEVPGFEHLIGKLESIYSKTKDSSVNGGHIPSLAGNKIYVDSYHKLLVYLLQSAEKITCSAACYFLTESLKSEKIPYIPLIYYHDELDFMVPDAYTERAKELGKLAFKEGPKLFNVNIMDGDGLSGKSWLEAH